MVVDEFQAFGEIVDPDTRQYRAEDFFAVDFHLRGHVVEQASSEPEAVLVALDREAAPIDHELRTLRHTCIDVSGNPITRCGGVAAAGKNPYLMRSYGQLLDEGRRILHMHFDYIKASTTDTLLGSEHRDMIEAIRARDVGEADRLAHQHTRQFHNRFVEFLSANYSDDFDFDLSNLPKSD